MLLRTACLGLLGKLITACGGTALNELIANQIHDGAIAGSAEPVAYDTLTVYIEQGGTRFVKVRLPNGESELRLYIERTADRKNPFYVGPLRRTFQDMPVRTAFFEYLGVRFITGMIDSGLSGTLDNIGFHHALPNGRFSLNARKLGGIHRDMAFLIPIFQEEFANWKSVQEVNIDTIEYIKEVSARGSHFPSPFERVFNPPIPIDSLFVKVPGVM